MLTSRSHPILAPNVQWFLVGKGSMFIAIALGIALLYLAIFWLATFFLARGIARDFGYVFHQLLGYPVVRVHRQVEYGASICH